MFLDTTLGLFTSRADKSEYIEHKPILIVIDEASYQHPHWSKQLGENASAFQEILALVEKSYEKGARHVFIDFSVEQGHDTARQNLQSLKQLIARYQDNQQPHHLYVVIGQQPDPCLLRESYYHQAIAGIWEEVALQNGNFYIHPVMPTYYESQDKVVRHWKLFTINQFEREGDWQWAFLPSPQLAYHTVKAMEQKSADLSQLPWLRSFQARPEQQTTAISRADYANASYEQLIKLSQSKRLQSYCQANGRCIPPAYTHSTVPDKTQAVEKQRLLAQLANKNAKACHRKINQFVENYRIEKKNHDALNNRIIYAMKSWQTARTKKAAYYELFTPIQLNNPGDARLNKSWENRFVAIGAGYAASRDINHLTPIGTMSGVLINLNAVMSFEHFGSIGFLSPIKRLFMTLLIIAISALIFARLKATQASIVAIALLIVAVFFCHQWLLANGIWLAFGLQLVVMNGVSFLFEGYEKLQE